ncbi:MAG: transposase [Candidatus Nitrosotalea sp.]|nr:transposase [Candidatus Nitrosotalea sp.]
MILTYNLKHGNDFSAELVKAKKIADFAIRTKSNTSKDVKHIGLKSAIANQILKKYRRRGIKKSSTVKLTIPGQSIMFDVQSKMAKIPCLGLELDCKYLPAFLKIRQVEIGKDLAHLSVEMPEPVICGTTRFIGVDCNTTGHCAVVAVPHTGKIHKLGRHALHIHKKYKSIRRKLQKQGRYQLLRQMKSRERNIIQNLNHCISKKLVQIAISEKSGIRFEKLKGIRYNKKQHHSFRYSINSWSYFQLQKFTEYKARMCGIEVAHIAPAYTSQTCSKCGSLGDRDKKRFQCVKCGHADHADVNAAFNIGKPVSHCAVDYAINSMSRLHKERDLCKGSTDTPLSQSGYQTATPEMLATVEPLTL